MSSKAAKRRKEYEERKKKRLDNLKREQAIRNATSIEEMAAAIGVKLR